MLPHLMVGIVKLGNHCALKLEVATKALFTEFCLAICLRMCPMARTALKYKHMASKFNPGVKMMRRPLRNDYLLKKLFVEHFFSIIKHWFFRLRKSYEMCAIIEHGIAHDLFNYYALVLCICIRKKLEWIFKNRFKQPMLIYSTSISKMELFVTIINGFYQILIVSYKSIIDVAGTLYLPQNR